MCNYGLTLYQEQLMLIYLKPEYRKGYTGYKFLKYSIKKLKKQVGIITLSMKNILIILEAIRRQPNVHIITGI